MKIIVGFFISLLVLLQYQFWFDDIGLLQAWKLKKGIATEVDENELASQRNLGLEAEVMDLKQGFIAVEERARSELGMVKRGEIFYQIIEG